ncbi:hypothetical protein [Streptomyces aureoverticillatus]|uniref:hypothetical protein n=1 Tax=Streptomyces aureoverticillatus TaxID=66871 RepID=UPI0013DBDE13|nr:hypothetical protein [Streptomyces aureoverticillatus]QIB44874.1 hypothetical protein G3H79_19115 [Streptomyces aureoverticillatus]
MRCIVAGHTAVTAAEFVELALGFAERSAGFDTELFTGEFGESEEGRAARLAVASEVLAELQDVDPLAAAYARALLRASDLPRQSPRARRARRKASARRAGVCAVQGVAVAA